MRYLTVLFLTAALASSASALTMDIQYIVGAPNQPAGTVCNSLVFDTEGEDWLSGQIVVSPVGGAIYQDTMGSEQSPLPAWIGMVPSLEFDSYISNGALGETCGTNDPVDLGGTMQWDAAKASMGWFTTDTDDIGVLELARITLDDTCQGTWDLRVTAYPPGTGPMILLLQAPIIDGHLTPEPATMGLLAIGGLGLLIRRKR